MTPDGGSGLGFIQWAIGAFLALIAAWNSNQQLMINELRRRQDYVKDSIRKEFREDIGKLSDDLRSDISGIRNDLTVRHRENGDRLDRLTELLIGVRAGINKQQ